MFTEIDEDSDKEAMTLEAISRFKSFTIPKGLARMSLMLMCERISKEKMDAPEPKKTLNRINYRFLKSMLDNDPKSPVFMQGLNALHDRLDGKPLQQTELTGADGGPVVIQASAVDEAL